MEEVTPLKALEAIMENWSGQHHVSLAIVQENESRFNYSAHSSYSVSLRPFTSLVESLATVTGLGISGGGWTFHGTYEKSGYMISINDAFRMSSHY